MRGIGGLFSNILQQKPITSWGPPGAVQPLLSPVFHCDEDRTVVMFVINERLLLLAYGYDVLALISA